MPRFHFHVHDGRDLFDTEGTEMPDVESAGFAAIRFAGEVLKDDASHVSSSGGWRVEVTDDAGHTLFQMSFLVVGSFGLCAGPGSGPRERSIERPDVEPIAE